MHCVRATEGVLAYVAIGSNLDGPTRRVSAAFGALAGLPGTTLVARSGLYRTVPVGYANQPDFVNSVALLRTALPPLELLSHLQSLERMAGRARGLPNGPRTLDLDLLLHGATVCDEARLTLPHPRMHERAFVLLPLVEIAPELAIPGHGTVRHLAARAASGGDAERLHEPALA